MSTRRLTVDLGEPIPSNGRVGVGFSASIDSETAHQTLFPPGPNPVSFKTQPCLTGRAAGAQGTVVATSGTGPGAGEGLAVEPSPGLAGRRSLFRMIPVRPLESLTELHSSPALVISTT